MTACSDASDCDDGDPCTADVCDPSNALGDLGGCVRDRHGFLAVACRLRGKTNGVACGDHVHRGFRRRVVHALVRASELVKRAATQVHRRRAMLRRAGSILGRISKRLVHVAARSPSPTMRCLLGLKDELAAMQAEVRALRSL